MLSRQALPSQSYSTKLSVPSTQRSIKSDQRNSELSKIHEALGLLNKALSIIPTNALIKWEGLEGEDGASSDLYAQAGQLYNLSDPPDTAFSSSNSAVFNRSPFFVTFTALIELSTTCATRISNGECDLEGTRECLLAVMSLLTALVSRMKSQPPTGILTTWNPSFWLSSVLACLTPNTPFEIADEVVRLLITLSESQFVRPQLDIDDRMVISRIFDHVSAPWFPAFSSN